MSDLTEEMLERAARAFTGAYDSVPRDIRAWAKGDIETMVRAALSAALAGRTVVDLPEPVDVITEPFDAPSYAHWDVDSYVVTAVVFRDGPRVNVRGGPLMYPDEAEKRGATLIAAAQTARRLAAESVSQKGGDQ